MTLDEISEAIKLYRLGCDRLKAVHAERFKRGTKVQVKAERYKGPGVVGYKDYCPLDQVPVLLGNGNTWWYPMEDVTPV